MRLLTRFGARSALRSSTCRQPRTVSGRPSVPPLEQARRPKERHAGAYRSELRPVIFSVLILGRHRFSPIAGAAQNMFSSHWSRISSNKRIHAIVIRSDFDVPIAGSVPQSVWLLPIDAAHSHLARNLEALLTYVRKSNRRGDRRPPHESLSAPPKK
jgi:hypothetical protein